MYLGQFDYASLEYKEKIARFLADEVLIREAEGARPTLFQRLGSLLERIRNWTEGTQTQTQSACETCVC